MKLSIYIFNKNVKIIALLISILAIQGCYHYHVSTSKFDSSTGYQRKTVHSIGWGLTQKNVIANNCDSIRINSLDEVRVSTNLGFALITICTVGFWCPMTIEWKCAKPCGEEGEIR